jgi:hypothetical protein
MPAMRAGTLAAAFLPCARPARLLADAGGVDPERDKPFEPLATTLVSSAPHPCFGAQRGYATRSSSFQGAGLGQIMGVPFAARLGALVKRIWFQAIVITS